MKHIIVAATVASMAVGLVACGHDSTPAAQLIGADKNCVEVAKPADPHGIIPSDGWPFPACSALSDVQPGVDQARAAAVVYDARARVVAAKREIIFLAAKGNQATDPQQATGFRDRISDARGRIADDLMNSRLALQGTPPQGFSLAYVRGEDTHTASPLWTGQGR
ncbi:hypothetical protein [Mycobacteroides abscessus]